MRKSRTSGGLAFPLPGALREPVANSATPVTYLPYSYVTEQKLGRGVTLRVSVVWGVEACWDGWVSSATEAAL